MREVLRTDLNPRQRRKVLDYADRVAELASEAPNETAKNGTIRAANEIRRRYGYTPEERPREVLRVLRLGAMTVADIVRETHFQPAEILDAIGELEEDGKVVAKPMERFDDGPPESYYFPELSNSHSFS